LIVPLTAAALEEVAAAGADAADDPAGADDGVEVDDELEEQAARAIAAMTVPPATAACLLPRSCIYSPCN
jgi:hypothetical protein